MNKFSLSDNIRDRLSEAEKECKMNQKVLSLHTEIMDTWEYRDRKGFELGDIQQLAESIRSIGQSQPIIVVEQTPEFRARHNQKARYVVIAGYRRWLACKLYAMPIQAIVREMTFDEALSCMISENEKEDVSNYSKGLFYAQILESEKISQEELAKNLNMSVTNLNQFLAFSQVPPSLWDAVGNMAKVSANTAATIRTLVNRGPEYLKALKQLAPEIARGQGAVTLRHNVEKLVRDEQGKPQEKVYKVEFDNKPLMTVKRGRVHIDKGLLKHPRFEELFQKLEKSILQFAEENLTKKEKK